MGVTEQNRVTVARPIPHLAFFAWATWASVCGALYWSYYTWTRGEVSIGLTVTYIAMAAVGVPRILRTSRDQYGGLTAATLMLLLSWLMMIDMMNKHHG
jgi:hypothetical protein